MLVFFGGLDVVSFAKVAVEDFEAERVEDLALDDALEGAGSVGGVVALLAEEELGGVVEGEGDILLGETGEEAAELDVHDVGDLAGVEPVEDDGLVDAVQKLGPEVATEGILHTTVALLFWQVFHDVLAADI